MIPSICLPLLLRCDHHSAAPEGKKIHAFTSIKFFLIFALLIKERYYNQIADIAARS